MGHSTAGSGRGRLRRRSPHATTMSMVEQYVRFQAVMYYFCGEMGDCGHAPPMMRQDMTPLRCKSAATWPLRALRHAACHASMGARHSAARFSLPRQPPPARQPASHVISRAYISFFQPRDRVAEAAIFSTIHARMRAHANFRMQRVMSPRQRALGRRSRFRRRTAGFILHADADDGHGRKLPLLAAFRGD